MITRTADASHDAALVPGIYEHCDQWCSYCPVTAHCLAYRRLLERQERHGFPPFKTLDDVLEFSREVTAEEGRLTPELDALVSGDPVRQSLVLDVDDPLDDMASLYAFEAQRFLDRRNWMPPVQPAPQPSPIDVVAWYLVLIPGRLERALAGVKLAASGRADRLIDANGCAKMVLVGIDRSHAALRRLRGQSDDARVVALIETLEQLGPAIERRFPSARAFIRPGIDGPLA